MKNRFFTILFLPSNPSGVKKLTLSEFLIKSLAISAMILIIASSIIFLDYVNVKKKEIDLVDLKEKTKIQNVQLQTFADKINDMEAELARLRSLDTKIRVLTNTNNEEPEGKGRRLSLGGQGGPEQVQLSFKNEASLSEMVSRLDRMNFEIKSQEKSLHELHASLQDQESILVATPSIWPVNGYLSSGFGYRESPFGGSNYEFHDGLDISAPAGTPVLATADGIVTLTGNYGDTGNTIIVSHGYGYETGYGHLSYIKVKEGQRIERGQEIGRVGSTGRSTGPHLHYLVKVAGAKVNPKDYLN